MKYLLLSFLCISLAHATELTKLEMYKDQSFAKIILDISGKSYQKPKMTFRDNKLILGFETPSKNYPVWDKKRSLNNKLDTTLLTYVKDNQGVVEIVFPYSVQKIEDQVSYYWKGKKLVILVPKIASQKIVANTDYPKPIKSTKSIEKMSTPTVAKPEAEILDESYLAKLESEIDSVPTKNTNKESKFKNNLITTDKVVVKEASVVKNKKSSSINWVNYGVKLLGFLMVVLALFYGIVQLIKKGVLKRGKLGFLKNHQLIEVLSTTYVSPKRSLMIIKAHRQFFLISQSESGFNVLGEINDKTGLVKEAEKSIMGDNFDSNLDNLAEKITEDSFKLKQNIHESAPVEKSTIAKLSEATKDVVKFSDEIRKKAKKLKPLEYN